MRKILLLAALLTTGCDPLPPVTQPTFVTYPDWQLQPPSDRTQHPSPGDDRFVGPIIPCRICGAESICGC